jgi:hypothetical protein
MPVRNFRCRKCFRFRQYLMDTSAPAPLCGYLDIEAVKICEGELDPIYDAPTYILGVSV